MWWILLACTPLAVPPDRGPSGSDPGADPDPADSGAIDTDRPDTSTPAGPCGRDGALVEMAEARFCIDTYEGALEVRVDGAWQPRSPYLVIDDAEEIRAVPAKGAVPQAYLSGIESRRACAAAGKRLCRPDEWRQACQGPAGWTWPYGPAHVDGACNDDYAGTHPVVDYFGTSDGVWDSAHMNDPGVNQMPGTVAKGGDFAGCESSFGAFDLHGNLHEWVEDPNGTFQGGFFADGQINGPGCTYRTTAHTETYHDYSTGFRCCSDPEEG